MTRTTTRARGSLEAGEIITVARRLIEHHGLDAFSMRKLAAELGVNPMTIYLRFENKDRLLEAVAADALGEIDLPHESGSPSERAVELAIAVRRHLLESRELLAVIPSAEALDAAMLRATDAGLEIMRDGGLAGADAVAGFRALFWHAVGFAMNHDAIRARQSASLARVALDDPGRYPTLAELGSHFTDPDPDAVYVIATRALVNGLLGHPSDRSDHRQRKDRP